MEQYFAWRMTGSLEDMFTHETELMGRPEWYGEVVKGVLFEVKKPNVSTKNCTETASPLR